eukprot:467492-Prorocentrum_minimum.AAC.1
MITNRTRDARVYSHDEPIGRTPRGYILTTNQSDAGAGGARAPRDGGGAAVQELPGGDRHRRGLE